MTKILPGRDKDVCCIFMFSALTPNVLEICGSVSKASDSTPKGDGNGLHDLLFSVLFVVFFPRGAGVN